MFTGIVEELGRVAELDTTADAATLTVHAPGVTVDAHRGASIAVNGVCLTVVSHHREVFTADVMAETLARTTIGSLRPGDPVNLERAMASTGRFGGHIVQGHVDDTAQVLAVDPGERWTVVRFALPEALRGLVADKGSIAVDGVSLTVVEANDDSFTVALIPTTLAVTTLGRSAVGRSVNLEVDVLAKYVHRLLLTGAVA